MIIQNTNQQEAKDQMPQSNRVVYPVQEDDIKLFDIFLVLINYKRTIIIVALISVALSIIIAILSPPVYQADVLLAPNTGSNSRKSGISALIGQYGGLANLAGISLGGGESVETSLAILGSRKFISDFVSELNLKPVLFAERWDDEKKHWIVREPSFLSKIKEKILPKTNFRNENNLMPGEPSDQEVIKKFREDILSVVQDTKTQLITLSIEWQNPYQSAEWANALVNRLNDSLRKRSIDEAERSIAYLKEQISETSITELQAVLYSIIEEHIKNITLAKVSKDFSMKVIDPAVPPEIRSKPNRKLIVVLGLFFGIFLGVFLAFVLNSIRKWKTREISE